MSITLDEISFDALPPIVLVHGFNTALISWSSDQVPEMTMGPYREFYCMDDPANRTTAALLTARGRFIQPFLDHGVPFDCVARGLSSNHTIEDGGTRLAEQFSSIAKSFGTRFVNVIAHSKGGLWTRHAIDLLSRSRIYNQDTRVGIVRVVSLDTPHLGSALAPLIVAGAVIPALELNGADVYGAEDFEVRTITTEIRVAGGYQDLTPAAVFEFNRTNSDALVAASRGGQLTVRRGSGANARADTIRYQTVYETITADPDYNRNGQIDDNEPTGPDLPPIRRPRLWLNVYRLMSTSSSFVVEYRRHVSLIGSAWVFERVRRSPSVPPIQNDLIVHVFSQRGNSSVAPVLNFPTLSPTPLRNSHTTVTFRCDQEQNRLYFCEEGTRSSVAIAAGSIIAAYGFEGNIQ